MRMHLANSTTLERFGSRPDTDVDKVFYDADPPVIAELVVEVVPQGHDAALGVEEVSFAVDRAAKSVLPRSRNRE